MTTSMNPPSNPHPLCDKPFNIEKRLLHDLLHSLANQYGERIQVQSQTITSTLYGAGLMKRKCMDLLWLLLVIGNYQVLMLYAQLLAAEVLLAIAASFNASNSLSIKPSEGSEKSDKTEIVPIQSIESKSSFEGKVLMLRNR